MAHIGSREIYGDKFIDKLLFREIREKFDFVGAATIFWLVCRATGKVIGRRIG